MNNLRKDSAKNTENAVFIKKINEINFKNSNEIILHDFLDIDSYVLNGNDNVKKSNIILMSRNTHSKLSDVNLTDNVKKGFISNQINGDSTNNLGENNLFEAKKNAIFNLIKNEPVEFGYYTNAEVEIKKLLKTNHLEVKDWICQIFYENYSNKNLLLKILYILSDFDYDQLKPQGPLIAVACASHLDEEVQEFSIRMFENWSNSESLKILKSTKYQTDWLNDYAKEVILDIEGE